MGQSGSSVLFQLSGLNILYVYVYVVYAEILFLVQTNRRFENKHTNSC